MAAKVFFICVTLFACAEFLSASPTRRQYVAITEATSDKPVTNDGTAWDDNDEFDLDGEGWFSQAAVSPSSVPEKTREFSDYDDDYSHKNVMMEFGADDEEGEEEDGEDDGGDDQQDQKAEEEEEEDGSRNDSEFLFVPPRDTRLVLEDDDDDQSGPIKVRHTGRSSYPRMAEGGDASLDTSEEDKNENDHSYEFTIDEDKGGDIRDEDDDSRKEEGGEDEDSVEVVPRHESPNESDDDEDEFVSEGGDESESDDMFDNPEEEAAQVIYGDHVFLY